jgi:hypothetical protein
MGGKLTSVLERTEHGHHVLRAYAKNAVIRMYEKFSTFLRLEALSNNLKDFGLNKGLDHLDDVRRILAAVTDRFAAFEAQALDVHVDFPLLQRLALPIPRGAARIPGIKLHDTRMLRLMEVLLHSGTTVLGWRTADIHQAILASFALSPDRYSITQLRYDLRKIKAHGLLERDGRRYAYQLTDYGTRPLCASCSSISASALRSPTASFTTDPIKPVGLTRNSTPPTAKPTAPSTKSLELPRFSGRC